MITLPQLRSSTELTELLDWPFEFSLEVDQDDVDETLLSETMEFTVIGTDATGGVFVALGQGVPHLLPILHGTSEGQAGLVASDLTEWLGVLAALPYWRDVLKFSSGGELSAMRETAELMSSVAVIDDPDLPSAVNHMRELLPIPILDDPVAVLHQNVTSTTCTFVDEEGDLWEGLFNSFDPAVLRSRYS